MGSRLVWNFLHTSCLIMKKTNSNSSWIDELIKWENAHPEYKPFKEDEDSQRRQNQKETY